ncbi:flagellar basal body P-ring formation chaperone FlgA [Pseudorhodoferax sp. Leaf274]|uniref:flagellar basal body P-ring formation chaperone FlgA n=1 Tax=Pseudorhodoferax sp. Leaf274 TaxID=1736318 RepID=UPI001F233F9C|nr:flagellar basal body P-ring formation chaperone FlgA [Pseudorhodoferax sp. Leaf274]
MAVPLVALATVPARVEDMVERAARDWLAGQADARGLAEPVFEVKAVAQLPQPLPPCAEALTVDALETRSAARMRFAVVCPGTDGWQREWTVRAAVSALVVVAARDVPANRALQAEDLAVERRRLTDLAGAVTLPEDAIAQSSNRVLRTGQALHARWLSAPVLVKRGDSVTIRARNGGVEVSAAGEALENGRPRQVVRVRNTTTGKVIRARVLQEGLVEPESMGGS